MTTQTLYPPFTIVLVDDEEAFLHSAAYALRREGLTNVETLSDSRRVMARLAEGGCGVLVLDMTMPYISGRDILEEASRDYPDVSVCMITAVNDVQSAVECVKLGAKDYILKPLQQEQLVTSVKRAIESRILREETAALKGYILDNVLKNPEAFAPIVTNNTAMQNLFKYVEAVAGTELPLLITGETGTGKELLARAIHTLSRRMGNLVCVNVAGIDDAVLSDSLFGHVRGAFTGADRFRKGLIEEAANGTLFLDEIGDLRPESQIKLLRLLQDGSFRPVGSDVQQSCSARFVFATHRDLKAMMHAGQFRADLYYRLQAHEVRLPPLRERPEDFRLLALTFVAEGSEAVHRPVPSLNAELYTLLSTYSWPGNVRELRGVLFDAVSRNTTETLSLKYLKEKLRELRGNISASDAGATTTGVNAEHHGQKVIFPSTLPMADAVEIALIREALRRTNGNKSQAADLVGLTRATIIKRLKESGSSDGTAG
ncbi:MAG: sigma-54 dependent transcriptional regulator [Ignavibacteriales bacterium]|nr:sigma-54 dependent transcriptional regulator [Ignavibacteriales bacterium]